jgi:hypothetical protein
VDLQNEDISPHALHLAFNRPRQDVFRVDQSARTLEKVKQTLQVYIHIFIDIHRNLIVWT